MPTEKVGGDAGKQIEEWKQGKRDFPVSRAPPRKRAAPPPKKQTPGGGEKPKGPASLKGSHAREQERRRRGEPTPRGITTTETLKKGKR